MEIVFILCKPALAEHIGFAARAMHTQGFGSLRLVQPCDYLNETTRKTGYGSYPILENAICFDSLQEARQDLDLVIGTTAKRRKTRHDSYTPFELAEVLQSKKSAMQKVGLAFGSEQSGLSAAEITACDLLSHIPMVTKHPSLNLSQSITVYAYALARFNLPMPDEETPYNPGLQKEFMQRAAGLLKTLDLHQNPSLHQRMLDRLASTSAFDMALMMQVLDKLDRKNP